MLSILRFCFYCLFITHIAFPYYALAGAFPSVPVAVHPMVSVAAKPRTSRNVRNNLKILERLSKRWEQKYIYGFNDMLGVVRRDADRAATEAPVMPTRMIYPTRESKAAEMLPEARKVNRPAAEGGPRLEVSRAAIDTFISESNTVGGRPTGKGLANVAEYEIRVATEKLLSDVISGRKPSADRAMAAVTARQNKYPKNAFRDPERNRRAFAKVNKQLRDHGKAIERIVAKGDDDPRGAQLLQVLVDLEDTFLLLDLGEAYQKINHKMSGHGFEHYYSLPHDNFNDLITHYARRHGRTLKGLDADTQARLRTLHQRMGFLFTHGNGGFAAGGINGIRRKLWGGDEFQLASFSFPETYKDFPLRVPGEFDGLEGLELLNQIKYPAGRRPVELATGTKSIQEAAAEETAAALAGFKPKTWHGLMEEAQLPLVE